MVVMVSDVQTVTVRAAADLAAAQVTAPVSGRVATVNVEIGQQVERGMEAIVIFVTVEPTVGWLVPTTAVQGGNGNTIVLVVSDGQPRPVSVTTSAVQDEWLAVQLPDIDEWLVVQLPEIKEGDGVVEDVTALFGNFPQRNQELRKP